MGGYLCPEKPPFVILAAQIERGDVPGLMAEQSPTALGNGASNCLALCERLVKTLRKRDRSIHWHLKLHRHHRRHAGTDETGADSSEERFAPNDAALTGRQEDKPYGFGREHVFHVSGADEVGIA